MGIYGQIIEWCKELDNMADNIALFLDRDGVIIENRDDYVKSIEEVRFLPGAIEAIKAISALPIKIVIITNQSAIGRGIVRKETVNEINATIKEVIEKNGGRIDDIFICPHTPEENCRCRKPKPGLLLTAIKKYNIVPQESFFVGDHITDLIAATNAGIKPTLVLSGRATKPDSGKWEDELRFSIYQNLAESIPDIRDAMNSVNRWSMNARTRQNY